MIRFSILLQKNMKKQEACTARIKEEDMQIKKKEVEHEEKDRQL